MVERENVRKQLERIGYKHHFWSRAEVKELDKILTEEETLQHCLTGQYEGGFALLAATDQRILLVDRKPMYLTIEAVPYDKISQIFFNHRLMNATAHIFTPNNNDLRFTSMNHPHLREAVNYAQKRMNEMRYYQQRWQEQTQADAEESDMSPGLVPAISSSLNPYQKSGSLPSMATIANQGLKGSLYTASRLPFR